MSRKRKLFMELFTLFLFICVMIGKRNVQANTAYEFTVYGSYVSDATQRYNFLSMIEVNNSTGGNWYGQYSKDLVNWTTFTGIESFPAGYYKQTLTQTITDIPAAKPTMSNNYSISFSSGTTYKCNIRALENKSSIYLRYFMKWNGESDYEEFKDGIITATIPDMVVGYYYTINNSSSNSLGSVSGASYQSNSAIPFDVSDIGQYLHVKAKSYSGALSGEKIIYLSKGINIYDFPNQKLTISCGAGISKVTATGSISGTTITATGSERKSGNFYPGETVTLTETPVSNAAFTDWNVNRSVSYLSGYDSGKTTTKFRMPNSSTMATANGKLYYMVTVKLGEGIKSVTLDGQTTSSSSGITKRYFEGDNYTISTILKDYYENPTWVADVSGYSKTNIHYFTEKMPACNITYTISAKEAVYSVSYTGLEGASPASIKSGSGKGGTKQTVTSTVPSKSGFVFAGWRCVKGPDDMLKKTYNSSDGFTLKQNTVFAAQWKAGTTTVNLHTNKPAEASSNVTHADTLVSGERFELKDIIEYSNKYGCKASDIINANGIERFALVQTKKYSTDSGYYTWYSFDMDTAMWLAGSGVSSEDLKGADRSTILVYDLTTQCYYRLRSTSDYWDGYHDIGIIDRVSNPGISNPNGGEYMYAWLAIGSSYKIYSEPDDFVELNSLSEKELAAMGINYFAGRGTSYSNISSFAKPGDIIWLPPTQQYSGGYYYLTSNQSKWDLWVDSYSYISYPYTTNGAYYVYLGESFKVPLPSIWTWHSTNPNTGDGYYSREFLDLLSSSDTAASLPKAPEVYNITGWKAKSWNTSADSSGFTYADSGSISSLPLTNESEKKIDLYAEWSPITYTVRYLGNGGKLSGGNLYYDVSYKYDTVYTYPQSLFEKESQNSGTTSYHFTNWYSSPQMTGNPYEVGQEFQNLTKTSGGMVYRYAGWSAEKIHYQIHFNPNGASEISKIADITGIEYSDNISIPSAAEYYSYKEHDFMGWILGTAISYEEYLKAPEKYQMFGTESKVSKLSNKNGDTVQMYALWKPTEKGADSYTIHFDGNGADSGSMKDQTIFCEAADTKLNKNIFGLTDYKFTGWNTKPDGSGIAKGDKDVADFSASKGDVITLYAQWIPDIYYIKYDGNGADSGDMDKSVFAYNTEESLSRNEYEKRGYHAENKRTWTKQADGSGDSYADTQKVNNLAEQPKGLIPNTVKLYVQWTANQYTIRFDGNGADSGSMVNQTKTYGTPITLLENQYQKEGYEFSGWSREPDGSGGLLPDKDLITNDLSEKDKDVITLYAQWKDVKPPVITPILPDDGSEDGDRYDLIEDKLIYEWTNQDVVLQFTAEDTGSGMKTLHLESEDGKIKVTNKDTIKKTITKEGITHYDLTAEDNTGNKTVLHITVKIDKIPPTADNEDGYVLDSSGIMTKTIKAHDEGGSGIRSFELYSGNAEDEENSTLTLLKAADSISGDNAELTYTFEDDMVSDKMYYTLVITDNAGNVTKKVFHVDPALSLQTKAWKYNKTTVTDDTETLTYMQYGDMRCWFETVLNGYMTEVTYDFCDELNELGLEDVTHALTPAETVTDNLVVYLPKTMVFEETYTVKIRGKRGEREVSVTLNLMHTEMKHKPHPAIRYQNDMAMPWGGGEWIDYKKLAEEQKKKAQEQKKQIDN